MTAITDRPICLSGGAEGADLQFGMCAGAMGHMVVHYSFAGHRTQAPAAELVVLGPEQLAEADPHLIRACQTLGRATPFHKPWVINLLRRNYFQIKDTESVYAVADLIQGKIDGGTAWAAQMFIDRFPAGEALPLYLFDQIEGVWTQWMGNEFLIIDGNPGHPPPPKGVWTGIGTSKNLRPNGKQAIRFIVGYEDPDRLATAIAENRQPVETEKTP
ncbi:MAG: hypothetical protein EOP83_04160 [Verrucomicrobiaceae bacterium]|nr:MAG: hypothetical protein EOP83_04160 [Verrucomicrobiaceae bacterium]